MTVQVSEVQLDEETPRIGVVIPVYSESDPISWVLGRFKEASVKTICIVVDVPLKPNMNKIREAANQSRITVHIIKNRQRTGVGSSLRQGLTYLAESGHDIAVIMAGNRKDDPAEIDRVVAPVVRGECGYVHDSRYLPGGKSLGAPITASTRLCGACSPLEDVPKSPTVSIL